MKTIVIFGSRGGLGTKLVPLFKDYNLLLPTSGEVDITNFTKVSDFFDIHDIDIVINLSGKKHDGILTEMADTLIYEMIDVNIMGNINILKACLPPMIRKRWGRVIGISSIFATMNIPKNSIYCASKAFIDRLFSNVNKENIQYGITCNTIQLGYWDGGMCERVEEKYKAMAKEKIGLKRWGTIEELYNTINYIIDNEYVCGTNIRIDGGL